LCNELEPHLVEKQFFLRPTQSGCHYFQLPEQRLNGIFKNSKVLFNSWVALKNIGSITWSPKKPRFLFFITMAIDCVLVHGDSIWTNNDSVDFSKNKNEDSPLNKMCLKQVDCHEPVFGVSLVYSLTP